MTYSPYWPGTTIVKSMNNAFTSWQDGAPSIFCSGTFQPNKNGRTASETATATVENYRAENGACRGTMKEISRAADILVNKHGGVYSKAKAA